MKKLLFSLIATVLFSNITFAQKSVNLIDIKGSELAVIINLKDDNSFTEFYLFQYNNIDFSKIINLDNLSFVQADKDKIIIKSDNSTFTLSIENKDKNVFNGYGLSKRNGNYKLIKNDNPSEIMDLVLSNNQVHKAMTCHSGGSGSTECSVTPSDWSAGTASCSVKCGSGYYSCCDDTIGECKCKVVKKE